MCLFQPVGSPDEPFQAPSTALSFQPAETSDFGPITGIQKPLPPTPPACRRLLVLAPCNYGMARIGNNVAIIVSLAMKLWRYPGKLKRTLPLTELIPQHVHIPARTFCFRDVGHDEKLLSLHEVF